uniref:histidine kinase n=1 Tax=Solibacter usitatus (strain Ellin6076) TaxID=234267 RepID=Q02B07_SOLUE
MPKALAGVKPRDADSSLRDAPIACHELDGEGNVVWINQAGCRLLGLPAKQILKRPIWEFVAPGERDSSRLAVQRKLSAELPLTVFERTYTRPDGSTLVLEIHEQYRRRANGSLAGIRSFMLDITARKRAEEELRKISDGLESRIRERTQELELAIDFVRREMDERRAAEKEHRKLEAQVQYSQRMESMGVLAGGVAHKFNNLLTTILGYASLAGTEMSQGSRAQEHLEQIIAAAGSAAELTQQMLAYSGRGQFDLKPLEVSPLVESTTRLLDSLVSRKTALSFELTENLPRIEADAGQFRQILVNLVNNAVEAMGERKGQIAISTGLVWAEGGELPPLNSGHMVPAGSYVYLEVADTGTGMDTATLAKIFDPFFTTKFTGRGLGLPAVLGIVRAHRGSIRVVSNPGEGTKIRVFFPALDDADLCEAAPAATSKVWPRAGTILVVDDEQPILRLAKTVLESAGLHVLTADDGNQAIQVFRAHASEIHAVLLDLTMPGMDGVEVFHNIHAFQPEARVVLCSGYDEHEASNRMGDRRPTAFLRKPYHPRELLKLLSTVW